MNANRIDPGFFSLVEEVWKHVHQEFMALGCTIPDKAPDGVEIRPDVSVGLALNRMIKVHFPEMIASCQKYSHWTPSNDDVPANQYPEEMLIEVRRFIRNEWLVKHAPGYFAKRCPHVLPTLDAINRKNAAFKPNNIRKGQYSSSANPIRFLPN